MRDGNQTTWDREFVLFLRSDGNARRTQLPLAWIKIQVATNVWDSVPKECAVQDCLILFSYLCINAFGQDFTRRLLWRIPLGWRALIVRQTRGFGIFHLKKLRCGWKIIWHSHPGTVQQRLCLLRGSWQTHAKLKRQSKLETYCLVGLLSLSKQKETTVTI